MRLCLALGILLCAAPVAAQEPPPPCPRPVRPGVGIGPLRLGMTAEEARAAASFVAPNAGESLWRLANEPGFWFRLGKDRHVEEIGLATSQPCLADGSERLIDLKAHDSHVVSPLPDCGGEAGMRYEAWKCPVHGIDFVWQDEQEFVAVRAPQPVTPTRDTPPPLPKPSQAKPKLQAFVPAGGASPGDAGVAAPPDPCAGNWAPMPKLACGFFGRGDALAIECYPTELCMGTFAREARQHLDVHGANGERLGGFAPSRGGRTLAFRFGKAPAVGALVRVYVDRLARVVTPASSYSGPNPPTDPSKDPKIAGWPAVALVGSRAVANGWVLDLQVPASAAAPPVVTLEKKASPVP